MALMYMLGFNYWGLVWPNSTYLSRLSLITFKVSYGIETSTTKDEIKVLE